MTDEPTNLIDTRMAEMLPGKPRSSSEFDDFWDDEETWAPDAIPDYAAEHAQRVELMAERYSKGLDLLTGEPLNREALSEQRQQDRQQQALARAKAQRRFRG